MAAMFDFGNQGLLVSPDSRDNPNNHQVPHHDAGVAVSFDVWNVGDEPGECRVGVEVDGTFVTEWRSGSVAPGANASPPMVSVGRYGAGEHAFLVYANPGSGNREADHAENRSAIA